MAWKKIETLVGDQLRLVGGAWGGCLTSSWADDAQVMQVLRWSGRFEPAGVVPAPTSGTDVRELAATTRGDGSLFVLPVSQERPPAGEDLLCLKDGKWKTASKVAAGPPPRGEAALCCAGPSLVLFGGVLPVRWDAKGKIVQRRKALNDTWRFSDGKWVELKPKKKPAARMGDQLGAVGLEDGRVFLTSHVGGNDDPGGELWALEKDSWRKLAQLPAFHEVCCLFEADGRAFGVAGQHGVGWKLVELGADGMVERGELPADQRPQSYDAATRSLIALDGQTVFALSVP
jgi:hypothetical protein